MYFDDKAKNHLKCSHSFIGQQKFRSSLEFHNIYSLYCGCTGISPMKMCYHSLFVVEYLEFQMGFLFSIKRNVLYKKKKIHTQKNILRILKSQTRE